MAGGSGGMKGKDCLMLSWCFWIRGSSIRAFPSGKELGRPRMVVPTGVRDWGWRFEPTTARDRAI